MTSRYEYIVDNEHYFNTCAKAAEYIGCSQSAVLNAVAREYHHINGHKVERINCNASTMLSYAMKKKGITAKQMVSQYGFKNDLIYRLLRKGIRETTSVGAVRKLAVVLDTDIESLLDF